MSLSSLHVYFIAALVAAWGRERDPEQFLYYDKQLYWETGETSIMNLAQQKAFAHQHAVV